MSDNSVSTGVGGQDTIAICFLAAGAEITAANSAEVATTGNATALLLDKIGATTPGQPANRGAIASADSGVTHGFLDAASRGRVWALEPTIENTY